MNKKRLLILYCGLGWSTISFAQKQLIMLKSDHVVARFSEGDLFKCILKNNKPAGGKIVELNEFSMITTNDTIHFQDAKKINMRGQHSHGLLRMAGSGLAICGLGSLAIGQFNAVIGVHSPSLTPAQWATPLAIAGVGVALIYVRPKYRRVNMGYFLHTIDYTSPFYKR